MPKPCKYVLQASTWALRVGEGIKGRWGQWVPQTQRRGCKRTRQSSLKVASYNKLALLMNLLTQRTLRQAGEANGMVRQFVPQIIPGKGLLVSAQRATGGKAECEHGLLPHGEGSAPSSCCCGEWEVWLCEVISRLSDLLLKPLMTRGKACASWRSPVAPMGPSSCCPWASSPGTSTVGLVRNRLKA